MTVIVFWCWIFAVREVRPREPSKCPFMVSMAMNTAPASHTSAMAKVDFQALLEGPAGIPPKGTRPEFANPSNLQAIFDSTLALCLIAATIVVFIRLYTKVFVIRSTTCEDCKSLQPPLARPTWDV